jgi:hypothetical protein
MVVNKLKERAGKVKSRLVDSGKNNLREDVVKKVRYGRRRE